MSRYPLFCGSQSEKLTKGHEQKTGPQLGTPQKTISNDLVTIVLGLERTLLGHTDVVGLILGQLR